MIVVNIDDINRKHYIKQDMLFRVGFGLASRLISYDNGILHIELEIRLKWDRSENAAVHKIAHCWKESHPEFAKAIACKIYIIDSRKYSYKRTLLHLGVKPGYDSRKGLFYNPTPIN